MIASDRDGAITRTDEPERSFGGTTGTGPYWPIPAGSATALLAPSPAADEMLVPERDLDVARELTETAGSAEYSCSPAAMLTAAGLGNAQQRADLMASQMLGLAYTRYVLQLPTIVGTTPGDLVRELAPTMQRYLTRPAPTPPGQAEPAGTTATEATPHALHSAPGTQTSAQAM